MKEITREQMIKDLIKCSDYTNEDLSKMDFWDIAELWEMFVDITDEDIEEIEKELKERK